MRLRIRPLGLLVFLAGMLFGCQANPRTPAPSPSATVTLRPLPTATQVATIPWAAPTPANTPAVPFPTPTLTPFTRLQPSPSPRQESYPLPTEASTAAPTATSLPPATRRPPPSPIATRAHPVYSGPPLDRSEVGIQVHLHHENIPLILGQLRALGVGWVKVQVSWKLHEPQPGRYDQGLFAELDQLVSGAAASDIYLLLSVAKAPEWSRISTELDGPPTDYALFEDFMRYLASRYRGQVAAYELWNESNLRREWNSPPLSAADFVALIRAGAAGVRSVDPLAIIVSGAPAPTGIHDYLEAVDDRVYLREMLAAGAADVVDAIGAHPYGWANPPEASAAHPDPAVPTHNNHPSFFFHDTLWDYFSILREAGRSEMQVWVTEFGWASFDGMDAAPPDGFEYMNAVSEWQQASYILRAYELAHQWRWVGPLFLWNLNFAPLLGTDYSESGYSLLRPDGSARPSYLALDTMLEP